MFRIDCPWCGSRDGAEFRCGGEAGLVRPAPAAPGAAWGEYLHVRNNVKGEAEERWLHAFGCGRWFLLRRDTADHRVLGASRFETVQPGGAA